MDSSHDDYRCQTTTNAYSCTCRGPKYCSKLPVVKGNLKYPNKEPSQRNICFDVQKCPRTDPVECECNCKESQQNRNFCMQTCDYDIQRGQEKGREQIHMSKVMRQSVKKDDGGNGKDEKIKSNNDELEMLRKQCPKGIEVVCIKFFLSFSLNTKNLF